MTKDANIVLNECAGILQYCQEVFEGLKAYTTVDGSIVTFRPDLNAERMIDSAKRMEMPPFPAERFMEAVEKVVNAVSELSKKLNIPANLKEMALVRLEYPESSLKELGQYLDPPVGKSGVNHRLRKLCEIADSNRK